MVLSLQRISGTSAYYLLLLEVTGPLRFPDTPPHTTPTTSPSPTDYSPSYVTFLF